MGNALDGVRWIMSRVIDPAFIFWTVLCVVMVQPAAMSVMFLLLIEICGIWFSIAVALLVTYYHYLYYYEGT
jgi:hypothetical protein